MTKYDIQTVSLSDKELMYYLRIGCMKWVNR